MRKKIKNIGYILEHVTEGIILVIALLVAFIVIILSTPFDYLKYRRSCFYRETGARFRFGCINTFTFRLYELIRKENLPIRYLMPSDPKRPCDGFFLAGSTLLIHDLPAIFYEERLGGWTAYPEDEEPLSDTVAAILLRLRTDYPEEEVTNVRILLDFDDEFTEHRARAQKDPLFLIYDTYDQLPALLRSLCTGT